MKVKDFKAGLTVGPQQQFDAGIASAKVNLAPVMAQLSASQNETICGQPSTLNWKTADAVEASISNCGTVPPDGDRRGSPTRTTSYQLAATEPGGEATSTATVNVDSQPTAMLNLDQPQATYHKIGDKVVEQGSATLRWPTSDGNIVTLKPLGNVNSAGSQNVEATPDQTTTGSVNRTVTYTLNCRVCRRQISPK